MLETPTNSNKIYTEYLMPDDHRYLTFLKKVFRHELRKNGFRRISTNIQENGVFRTNSEKGIMKAYLENHCSEAIQPLYYYYMDSFFGSEHLEHRIGTEIIGENDPILDAISISITNTILKNIGLENDFKIRINSFGVEKEQIKYSDELTSFYDNKKHLLSDESLKKLEKNPILLLNSDLEDEKILAEQAPSIIKFLKKDSKTHYSKVKEYLDLLNVEYIEDNLIVPQKKYNTNTVWEFRSNDGNLISRGARYNKLAKELGSPKEVPATGFYLDSILLINMLKEKEIKLRNKDKIDLFFVQLGDEAKKIVLTLSSKAREAGINTVVSLGTPSMKEQMLKATRSGTKYIVMVGVMEAMSGIFQVRNIEDGTQEEVKKEDIISYMIEKVGNEKLDFYSPAKDLIKE